MSGAVAGKGTACPVRSVGPRRQPQNQETSSRIAPSRHRLGPVLPIDVGATLFLPNFSTMGNQARTLRAGNDFLINLKERGLTGAWHFLECTAAVTKALAISFWPLALGPQAELGLSANG